MCWMHFYVWRCGFLALETPGRDERPESRRQALHKRIPAFCAEGSMTFQDAISTLEETASIIARAGKEGGATSPFTA